MIHTENFPSDWQCTFFANALSVLKDGTHFSPQKFGGCFPYVTSKNIRMGRLDLSDLEYIPDDEHMRIFSSSPVAPGDVLLTKDGARTGNACINTLQEEISLLSSVAYLRGISGVLSNEYLLQWLLSPRMQFVIRSEMAGQAITRLTLKTIGTFPIILPPLPEQKAIADLLSTWDQAIEKLEALIRAKERRYKWLLTHCMRTEDGATYLLRDLCDPIRRKNLVDSQNVLTSSAQNGLVSQSAYYKKSVSAEDLKGYFLLQRGEFAYNRSSAKGYPFGAIKRLDLHDNGVLSTLYFCFALKENASCLSDYLLYYFESGAANRALRAVCQEGARSHGLLNITMSDFYSIPVQLPSVEVQRVAVAQLNAALQELQLLKQLAEKYKAQKRGLMQRLLTGEWRVKPEVVRQFEEN